MLQVALLGAVVNKYRTLFSYSIKILISDRGHY